MASWKLIEHENDPLFVFLKFKSIQHFAKVQGRSFTCSLNIILILIKNYTMKFRKKPKMALQEIDHVYGLSYGCENGPGKKMARPISGK